MEEEKQQDLAAEDQQDTEQTQDVEQPTQPVVETRQVPLEALESERRKRQELEYQLRMLQQTEKKDEDDDEWISKGEMKRKMQELAAQNKREILEEAFCEANPDAVNAINQHLENIIKRKPWLAQSIETAPNRFARAYEIIQDYMPKEAPAQKYTNPKADAQRALDNSKKPGNPVTISKGSSMNNAEYLRSIAGKPEFREYRKKVMTGG